MTKCAEVVVTTVSRGWFITGSVNLTLAGLLPGARV